MDLPRALLRGQTTNVLPELAAARPALGRGYDGGLPPLRPQPGVPEPAALLPLARRLPAGADRSQRSLVAGTGTSRGDAAFNYISQFVVTGTLPSIRSPWPAAS